MAKNKTSRYIPYIENQYIPTKTLGDDFEKPDFIARILRLRKSGLTIWPMTPRRKAVQSDRERYACVVQGKEEFRLVSPVFKQNIYSGVIEELNPTETPLDFF
jgi:hypothetical protein